MDSVQLAKSRKSGASGHKAGHGDKLHPVKGDKSNLPPSGAKSRFGDGDKANSGKHSWQEVHLQASSAAQACAAPGSHLACQA